MFESVRSGPSSDSDVAKWYHQPWKTMADLAEAVDDLICSFDYMDTAMDNLAMILFVWTTLSLFLLWLGKFLYTKYVVNKKASDAVDTVKKSIPAASDDATKKQSTTSEVVNSSEGVLAASAKIKASSSSSSVFKAKPVGAMGGGGFVPPTPPNKKRLSRMSPGPDHPGMKRAQSVVAPTCTGSDAPSCNWVNDMFLWLYNDLVIVNELIQFWIVSMNEFSKKSVEEQGIGVELVRALDSHPPSISNVFCECDTKDDVTITCDCEATPAFQLKAFRQKGEKVEVSHYRVNVNRFRARISIVCITDKLSGEVRCDGWPEVKVALAPVGPLRPNADEASLQDIVSEIIVSALRNTHLEFNFSQYPTCPRLKRHNDTPSRLLPLHYDSLASSDRTNNSNMMYTSTPNRGAPATTGATSAHKRLLVKVVGARDLGGKAGCRSPYCVVEMDEPPQKNQTAAKKETVSPVWEEHFLFDLSPNTAELLFEIYDRGTAGPTDSANSHRFLGLGLVGIDELLVSPSQRQQIGLQGRPMEDEDVSGVLTVEFLFIEGADIPDMGSKPFKLKETLKTVSPTGQTLTTTKTTFKQNGQDNSHLTQSALRELELSPANANKSTLIIHSVQRTEPKKSIKVEMTESGRFVEIESCSEAADESIKYGEDSTERAEASRNGDVTNSEAVASTNSSNASPARSVTIVEHERPVNGDSRSSNGIEERLPGIAEKPGDYVNNMADGGTLPPEKVPRRKRRDFFGTIKRRLGRSKTRNRSMDNPESESEDQIRIRSISADRSSDHGLIVPVNRNVYSAGASPAQSGDESRTSRRSSLSEMSGISTASARTFIHEASTLVLETIEAGIKKHYLVPLAIAQRSRWRRKGVKLHIFNDHTFIAKHLSGGTVCAVCLKSVARRIGKQGYECRDCLLKCHKHCHVKVVDNCPQTTIHSMELSYIASPYTDKNIRML